MSTAAERATIKRKHWCEGLDWIPTLDILVGTPELLPRILANTLELMSDYAPAKRWRLHEEAERRIKAGEMDDDMRDAFVEATRIVAENAKRHYERLIGVLERSGTRVVADSCGKTRLVHMRVVDGGAA